MISIFYPGKMRQFPRTFMIEVCSNDDVINDVFGRQEDKNCHQVKMWPLTHQLVNKSIVLLELSPLIEVVNESWNS